MTKSSTGAKITSDETKTAEEESKSPVDVIADEAKFALKVQEIKAEQKIISVGEALMDTDDFGEKQTAE